MKDDFNLFLKQRYLAINLIGLAMIASVFIYAALVGVFTWWLPDLAKARVDAQTGTLLKSVFGALALATFFLIKLLQKIIGARSVQMLPQAAIVSFALCESVAVLGLVLFFLTGRPMDYFIFMFLSLFYFWFFFPKYPEWEERFKAASSSRQT